MEAFAEYLAQKARNGKLAEIGVGFNFKVALKLKELGLDVFVVDWNKNAVEKAQELGIKAYVDDVFKPNLMLYEGVKIVYAVRPTPEIVRPILELARKLGVPAYILPFSLDEMPRELKLENYKGLAIYKKD
ncbi:hypothetical protein PAP_05025 [Palaeococcus pacificus DY20341]|uniref:UPF0146 protein PAP_05025 n=2 Tax=Palaeococcus TaxID=83867 RepID=A0A075LTG0_9EURY|nr:hypothetical protein PAP_05025 [Palaeococcus pacificus DY20341]